MVKHLKNIPLFKSLSDDEFTSIQEKLEEINFTENTLVFEAGEIGDCLYIILEGEVEVFIDTDKKAGKIILSGLGKGDYFGEMSLITGEPRSASVSTLTECTFLRLAKSDFDQLILNNPSITISLSHMLSQRLKSSNIKMAQAESVYQSKIKPKGNLEEHPLIEVLKFCEQNSLTGLLKLNNNDQNAELEFLKGQLQKASFNDLTDDEAMDEILNWEKGAFEIEPTILNIDKTGSDQSESEKNLIEEFKQVDSKTIEPIDAIVNFALNLVNRLISIIGSKTVQDIFNKVSEKTTSFFPEVKNFTLEISKSEKIKYNKNKDLNDKDYLALGVFLQLFIEECKQQAIGMSFLDISGLAFPYQETLQNISFFDYMSHAKEFVHQ